MKKKGMKGRVSGWRNVPIGRKYLYVFLLSAVLFLTSGTFVSLELQKGNQNVDATDKQSAIVNEMSQLALIIQAKDVQIADYLLIGSSIYVDNFKNFQREFNELAEKLQPAMQTKEQQSLLDTIIQNDKKLNEMFFGEIASAVQNKQHYMAASIRNQSSGLRTDTVEKIDELMNMMRTDQIHAVQSTKSSFNASIWVLAIGNISAVLIGIIVMLAISRKISANLKAVIGITGEVSKGNLRVPAMNYQGKDEIGQLNEAVYGMKDNIRNILAKVATAAVSIAKSSERLKNSAMEVKEGNEQIATTMEELSTGADTQANSTSNLSENMNDFVEKVHLSEKSGQEITKRSNNVLALTTEGSTLMKKSVEQMKQIDTIVSEAVDRVQQLDKQSDEISKLISVIKDIAEQTNLLSLNAAIEAARAGEHGKGFAVVADEVRKLSEQVALSVGEITVIVQNIQSETDHVAGSLHTGFQEVREGTNQIENTRRNFETIHESVSEMADKISAISANLKDIAENSKTMNGIIEDIASVSEESAAGAEQAAAASQQNLGAMEVVSNDAEELALLAEQLDQELRVFRL